MKIKRSQSGASIIEFALVAMIFFLVMWGIIEFGRAFYVQNSSQQLTRCVARTAVVRLPTEANSAISNCLISVGGSPSWPFYQIAPSDMTNFFQLTYYFKDGSSSDSSGLDSTYNDQLHLCSSGVNDNKCVESVEACLKPNTIPGFGLLSAWMGAGNIKGFASCTRMPAEAMGYVPP